METTKIRENEKCRENHVAIIDKYVVNTLYFTASLIGVWSISCAVGALYFVGFGSLIKGFLSSIGL